MRAANLIVLMLLGSLAQGQTRVSESFRVDNQRHVDLDLAFGDEIILRTWDKKEVVIEASVSINGGEDDDIFEIKKRQDEQTVYFELDRRKWEKRDGWGSDCCNWQSDITYVVSIPEGMILNAETISASYTIESWVESMKLKTISGDIDVTVNRGVGVDFKAKTISGEVYSDLDIDFPDGKDGLRKIVGMDVYGRVHKGGELLRLETISGNIFLRKD